LLIGFIRNFIFREFRLKAVALLLAVVFWFSANYMGQSKMGFMVPVSFYNVDKGEVITETDTRNILITVNGPPSILKNLKAGEIRVPVNLSRVKEGRHVFSIGRGDVIVPPGLKVEDARPDYVVVELDKIVEKRLRVVVRLDKKWQGAYEVASWRPVYVYVEGPRESLQKKDVLETLPVSGNFTRQQEVLDIPLDAKSLDARKVVPETARVVLRRTGS
jgi:YbbR domain-containing protein